MIQVQCNEIYPDATSGVWCCHPWCYVDPSCTLLDTQPTTISGAQQLYYSYQACANRTTPKYTDATCPWQQAVSFEDAAAAIMVAEKIGNLLADSGTTDLAVITTPTSKEVAITAGKDATLCLYVLRAYGGQRTSCVPTGDLPIYSFAATSEWIATVTEGAAVIQFWNLVDSENPSLLLQGSLNVTSPVRYLKHSRFGLLASGASLKHGFFFSHTFARKNQIAGSPPSP